MVEEKGNDDPRRVYIAKCISSALSADLDASMRAVTKDRDGSVQSFVDGQNNEAIAATKKETKVKITKRAEMADSESGLVVSKLDAGALERDDFTNKLTFMIVSGKAPIRGMSSLVANCIAPEISKLESGTKIDRTAKALQHGLHWKSRARNWASDSDELNLDGIPIDGMSLWDELDAWTELMNAGNAHDDVKKDMKKLAKCNTEAQREMYRLNDLDDEATIDLIDKVKGFLDDIWNVKRTNANEFVYREHRMSELINRIGEAIRDKYSERLNSNKIWSGDYRNVEEALNDAQRVLQRWKDKVDDLVNSKWRTNKSSRQWKGEAVEVDEEVGKALTRLSHVKEMRSQHSRLSKMVESKGDKEGNDGVPSVKRAFELFNSLDPVKSTEGDEGRWYTAERDFNKKMEPLERMVADKIRTHLSAFILPLVRPKGNEEAEGGAEREEGMVPNSVWTTFKEVESYASVFKRDNLKESISDALNGLNEAVDFWVDQLENDFENENGMGNQVLTQAYKGRVRRIVWAKMVRGKADVIARIDTATRGKRSEQNRAQKLKQLIDRMVKEEAEKWEKESMEAIKDPTKPSEADDKLIRFDKETGEATPNLSERMLQIARESYQLRALKISVPGKIVEASKENQRYQQSSVDLKRVATIYNELAESMHACHKPMLRKDAENFESLISNPKDSMGRFITWQSAESVDKYTKKLRKAAERYKKRNEDLQRHHKEIEDIFLNLFDVDLAVNKDKWDELLHSAEKIFNKPLYNDDAIDSDKVEDPKAMEIWRQHWDCQLAKVLEARWLSSLQRINRSLGGRRISMELKGGRVAFDVPMHQLRREHYSKLNAFLNIPHEQVGFSKKSRRGSFAFISEKMEEVKADAFQKAEKGFHKLQHQLESYQEWVSPKQTSLSDVIQNSNATVEDFNQCLEEIERAKLERRRWQNEETVDRYVVSLMGIKKEALAALENVRAELKREMQFQATQEFDAIKQKTKECLEDGHADVLRERLGEVKRQHKEMEHRQAISQRKGERTEEDEEMAEKMCTYMHKLEELEKSIEEKVSRIGDGLDEEVERFKEEMGSLEERWEGDKRTNDGELLRKRINACMEKADELKGKGERVKRNHKAFNRAEPELPDIEAIYRVIANAERDWEEYNEVLQESNKLRQADWMSAKMRLDDVSEFISKWSSRIRSKEDRTESVSFMVDEVDSFKKALPLLRLVMGRKWDDSHWAELLKMLGLPTSGESAVDKQTVKLGNLVDKADVLAEREEKIKQLDARAQGEVVVKEALQEVKRWGFDREFKTKAHVTSVGEETSIVLEVDEALAEIADNQSYITSAMQSKFVSAYKEEAENWERKLETLTNRIELLSDAQRKWLQLEQVLSKGALPSEQSRFSHAHDDILQVLNGIKAEPLVKSFAERGHLESTLEQVKADLDICQRALSDYLTGKRDAFPRFGFLGDDDLLEFLSNSQSDEILRLHLHKLFPGMKSLELSEDRKHALSFSSEAGEMVKLDEPIPIAGCDAEDWLARLESSMRSTLASQVINLREKKVGPEEVCEQVLAFSSQLDFCKRAEDAISNNRIAALKSEMEKELASESDSLRKADTGMQQVRIRSLLLDKIHNVDVLGQLVDASVRSVSDWDWQRQLRFYEPSGRDFTGTIRMGLAEFEYKFEYQGNATKLVHTPLTDKCFLTLTQALKFGYGGNPYGPAGTGKTESVKALGQALGRQVLVFNCDEEFDFQSMGRILQGLVRSGAFGCFDEINRLNEQVLSAVSQQVQSIQNALRWNKEKVELLGKKTSISSSCGVFITMNPAGSGYGGRSKLPDNLKQLFRGVAMAKPNSQLITEVLLRLNGFSACVEISQKMVCLLESAENLLTRQQHYDWGLRTLKTSILLAGKMNCEEERSERQNELERALRATRLTIMPKLTENDKAKFLALTSDIFPNVESNAHKDKEALKSAIRAELGQRNLQAVEELMPKLLELHTACHQRIGVLILGPTGSGKTTLWQILSGAYRRLSTGKALHVNVLNPKAMSRQALLGRLNKDSREWSDGVLTAMSRTASGRDDTSHSWIICDGDFDPEWLESLNSVLDDNRLMTLPNGERIQFKANVNFIFECDDITNASPATISRANVIHIGDGCLSPDHLMQSWMCNRFQKEELRQRAQACLQPIFTKSIDLASKHIDPTIQASRMALALNAVGQLSNVSSKREACLGLAKGLGAYLEPNGRQVFANELSKQVGEANLLTETKQTKSKGGGDVVQFESMLWAQEVLQPWLQNGENVIIWGPKGSGKSLLVEQCIKSMNRMATTVLKCSISTTGWQVIQRINRECGKPVSRPNGKVHSPSSNQKLVFILKNSNLAMPDKFASVQLDCFLQQVAYHGGYFDETNEFVRLERIQFVATMCPPSNESGFHSPSPRLLACFRLLHLAQPTPQQLLEICDLTIRNATSSKGAKTDTRNAANAIVDVGEATSELLDMQRHPQQMLTPHCHIEIARNLGRYQNGDGENNMAHALTHEINRRMRDMLVDDETRKRFDAKAKECITSRLGSLPSMQSTFFSSLHPETGTETNKTESSSTVSTPPALVAVDENEFKERLRKWMDSYKRDVSELNHALLHSFMNRVSSYDCELSKPGGSLLLFGRPGVGRRTCVHFVSYMQGKEVVEPMPGNQQPANEKADILLKQTKKVLTSVGAEGERVALFVGDTHLQRKGSVELMNDILSTRDGEQFFSRNELDTLMNQIRSSNAFMHNDNNFNTPDELFRHRIQTNLNVIISIDANDAKLRSELKKAPSIVSECASITETCWSQSDRKEIVKQRLDPLKQNGHIDDKEQRQINETITRICDGFDASPRQLVSCADEAASLARELRDRKQERKKALSNGLGKLNDAEARIEDLSNVSQQQRLELTQKQEEADEALNEITSKLSTANERHKEVDEEKAKLAEEEKEMGKRKAEVEKELSDAQPLIDAARKAVGQIKADNLTEIRSLKTPPEAIRDVLEALLRLMGNKDTSWQAMRTFLGGKGIKDTVLNFDARTVKQANRKAVEEIVHSRAQSFDENKIARVSAAAAPFASWVKANIEYSKALEQCRPLEEELEKLNRSVEESKRRLERCEEDGRQLDEEVVRLRQRFSDRTREGEVLKENLDTANSRLENAQSLLSKLSDEKDRWGKQVSEIDADLLHVPTKAAIGSLFINFLAAEDEKVRQSTLSEWTSSSSLDEFQIEKELVRREGEEAQWQNEGLNPDKLSIENAVSLLRTRKTPILIDPTGQTNEWLIGHLEANGPSPERVAMHSNKLQQRLELAARFGKGLVIEEADYIEPILHPILREKATGVVGSADSSDKEGKKGQAVLGDKRIDVAEGFAMYLTTRKSEPEILKATEPVLTRVNFTVTKGGLEEQLLRTTMQHEQPDLEQQKEESLQKERDATLKLRGIQDQLLEAISKSEGNLLDNSELIRTLDNSKEGAESIHHSLSEAKSLQEKLDVEREGYRELAVFGSDIYLLVSNLPSLSHVYRFSLLFFKNVFTRSLSKSNAGAPVPSDTSDARVEKLRAELVIETLSTVSRSLFKCDRLAFAVHVALKARPDLFEPHELSFFLDDASSDTSATRPNASSTAAQTPAWVPASKAPGFKTLMDALPDAVSALDLTNPSWGDWMNLNEPEKELGSQTNARAQHIGPLRRLLAVKALRPDRLEHALESTVAEALQLSTTELGVTQHQSFASIVDKEPKPSEPMLLLTSPGGDPTKELARLAESRVGAGNYKEVALGQDQESKAASLLEESVQSGGWLCIKNIHLAAHWLPTLEKKINSMEAKHSSFRLFLTSEASADLPAALIQACLKFTTEPPPGVRPSIERAIENWESPNELRETAAHVESALKSNVLFLIAFLHAVASRRCDFVPQGWLVPYEFSFSDMSLATDIVNTLTESEQDVDFKKLRGLLKRVVYGARMALNDSLTLRSLVDTVVDERMCSPSTEKALPGTEAKLPDSPETSEHMSVAKQLPDKDSMRMLSLAENSGESKRLERSNEVLEQVRGLAKAKGDGGADVGGVLDEGGSIRAIVSLWSSLKQSHEQVREAVNVSSGAKAGPPGADTDRHEGSDPVGAFLEMEARQATRLVREVERTLQSLNRLVVRGSSAQMSQEVRTEMEEVAVDKAPRAWRKIWSGPCKAGAFLNEAVKRSSEALRRLAQMEACSDCADRMKAEETALSSFLEPRSFLASLRHRTSQRLNVPMEKLTFHLSLSSADQLASLLPVGDLSLEGAKLVEGGLMKVNADEPTLQRIPPVLLGFCPVGGDEAKQAEKKLEVAMYDGTSRANEIGRVDLPVRWAGEKDEFTLDGVALFLGSPFMS